MLKTTAAEIRTFRSQVDAFDFKNLPKKEDDGSDGIDLEEDPTGRVELTHIANPDRQKESNIRCLAGYNHKNKKQCDDKKTFVSWAALKAHLKAFHKADQYDWPDKAKQPTNPGYERMKPAQPEEFICRMPGCGKHILSNRFNVSIACMHVALEEMMTHSPLESLWGTVWPGTEWQACQHSEHEWMETNGLQIICIFSFIRPVILRVGGCTKMVACQSRCGNQNQSQRSPRGTREQSKDRGVVKQVRVVH